MWISTAFAQGADGATDGGSGFIQLLPLVLIFVVFWFLLIRPQQKKMKRHKAMVEGLRRGDRIVTGGGLIGTVIKVIDDSEAQVELAELQLRRNEEFLRLADARFRVGQATMLDVRQAEVAKGQSEVGLLQAGHSRRRHRRRGRWSRKTR